jgi:outer membrane protein assembly factor BamA
MTARGRCALSIFFALLLGPLPALAQAPTAPPERPILVKEIAVQGNRRVQEAVILGRVTLKIGTPFVANRTAEDIRAIFALGFFDDVQVRVEDFEGGVKLTYVVTERPFVRDVPCSRRSTSSWAPCTTRSRSTAPPTSSRTSTRRRATSRSASPRRSRSSRTAT